MSATVRDNTFKTVLNDRQNEEQNMTDIYNYILSLDSNITCDTTVTAEYSNPDTTHVPTFNFTFRNNFVLRMTRQNPLSTNFEKKYYFSAIIRGNEVNKMLYPVNDNQYYARFITAIDTDFFFLWYGSASSQNATPHWSMGYVKDEYGNAHAGSTSASGTVDITTAIYYDLTDGSTGQFASLINFGAPAGYIGISDKCPFVGSGNTYLFSITDLFSCSAVTLFSTVALNNGHFYFAIGTHTLIEITP